MRPFKLTIRRLSPLQSTYQLVVGVTLAVERSE